MISFTHTEVPPEFGGRGIGGKLVQASLDDARAQGLLVNPICSYYTYWIVRHPEYADVVRH